MRKSIVTVMAITIVVMVFGYVVGYTITSITTSTTHTTVRRGSVYIAPDLLIQDTSCINVASKPMTEPEIIFHNMSKIYSDTNKSDLLALSVALYTEARGESWNGISAVSNVIRNRVQSSMFPNTYYKVVTQPGQFSGIVDNNNNLLRNINVDSHNDRNKFIKIIVMAYRTIDGQLKEDTSHALFYHASNVKPFWASHYHKLGDIGHHVFYTTAKL